MRNLKRALSLTLASVMLLGMMVVGASAAGFPDVEDTHNVEAIEVLKAVDVMVGDDKGNFGPDQQVSRAQMAVVMAKLLNLDYNYYQGQCKFTDVPNWAAPYVAACYANGIVSGYNDTTYGANDDVTAVQAASMMMRALGYFKYKEDYQPTFELATVKQASEIGIFSQVKADAKTPLTRNQVAQMALNALRTEMVTFTGTPGFEANGVTVGYRAEYTQRTSTEAKYHAIEGRTSDVASDANHKGQYYIQLGEQLYDGKLKLSNDIDVFGRPSRKWEFDGKGVGTYAKTELLDKEYVGEVTGKDLFDLLGATTLKDYTTYAFVDGVWTDGTGAKTALGNAYFNAADMNKNNKAGVGATGTGTLTQVYVDHDKDLVYVVVINTYLAIANKDYDTKKEEVDIAAYSIKKNASISEYIKVAKDGTEKETFKLAIEDFPEAESIKKNDPLLITVADGEVQTIKPAEVLSAVTITSFKLNSNVTVDGTKYNYTTTAGYKAGDLGEYTTTETTRLKDRSYNVYLDVYGNLIGVEEVEAVKNYVFITGIDLNGSNRVNQVADASAIFLDGTMDSIKVNMTKSEWKTPPTDTDSDAVLNTWCTYTKNGDVYTLKEVSDVGVTKVGTAGEHPANVPSSTNGKLAQFNQQSTTTDITIDAKNYRMYGGGSKSSDYYNVYGDVDTVYITAKLGELKKSPDNYGIIKGVASVSTGIANTDLYAWTNAKAVSQADADDVKVAGTPGAYPKTSSGVYGLYNDKGLIIAAVVIGEDAGTAKDLVYVHTSSLEEEIDNGSSSSRAAGDGLWTWTRKVISNGEEVLLTEVGDYYDGDHSLSKMQQYRWYQIRTNAAGNVIEAKEATVLNSQTGSRFVTEYDKINDNVELSGVDTVLYLTNGGPVWNATKKAYDNGYSGDLEVKGNRTLAITNEEGSGIWFRDDVNVVLQYWNRNKQMDDILTGEGVDDLKEMVDIVNDNNDYRDENDYFVSALIEDGRATTIVIFDSYNNYKRPGDTTDKGSNGDVDYAKGLTTAVDGAISNDVVTVQPNGRVNAKFTLTAPNWVYMDASNKAVTVYFDVFMDGETVPYGSGYKTINSSDNETVTFISNLTAAGTDKIFDNINESKGHTLSMEITGVEWPAAKVEVWNEKGTAKLALTSNTTNNPGYLTTAPDGNIKFHLNTASDGAGTYTVTGALKDDGTEIKDQTFSTNLKTAQVLNDCHAVGGEVVKVFVKGEVVQNYTAGAQGEAGDMAATSLTNLKDDGVTVTGLPDDSDDWDATLAVTVPVGPLAEGTTSEAYTITLAGHADGIVKWFDVSYTLTNGSTTTTGTVNIKELGSGSGTATVYVPAVKGDVDLTITSVKATVMSFVVTGATVASDKKSVTISFSESAVAVMADANINSGGSGNNIINVKKDGSTNATDVAAVVADGKVTLTSSNAFETGATIEIDAPIVNAKGEQVKACLITLTLTGDVWSADIDNT